MALLGSYVLCSSPFLVILQNSGNNSLPEYPNLRLKNKNKNTILLNLLNINSVLNAIMVNEYEIITLV